MSYSTLFIKTSGRQVSNSDLSSMTNISIFEAQSCVYSKHSVLPSHWTDCIRQTCHLKQGCSNFIQQIFISIIVSKHAVLFSLKFQQNPPDIFNVLNFFVYFSNFAKRTFLFKKVMKCWNQLSNISWPEYIWKLITVQYSSFYVNN